MTSRALLLRGLLYVGLSAFSALGAPGSWVALLIGAIVGLSGLALEARLRSRFDGQIAVFTTVALLTSASLAGPPGEPHIGTALAFAASSAAFFLLGATDRPRAIHLTVASAMAITPTAAELWGASSRNLGPDNALNALFGAHGLLYGAPLLWGGLVGLISLRHRQPGLVRLALAAIIPGLLSLLLAIDESTRTLRTVTWIPFLLPGLARCFEKARSVASRHPHRVTACAGLLMVLWNLLFIEQYRRRFLPSDDTVSFSEVTSNSASILSGLVGTPFAWPANWIFAARINAQPDRFDVASGRSLFANKDTHTATIELGDDESVTATDAGLRLENFGPGHTCERGFCRDVYDAGRILLPLPDVGHTDLIIRVRARGEGSLKLSLDDRAVTVADMTETLNDISLRVPGRLLTPGISVLGLTVVGGGRATVDRITLERDLSSASAR